MDDQPAGIDVNHWKPIKDVFQVIAAGIKILGIKGTEGETFTDPTLADHLAAARDNPFSLVWIYCVARPGGSATHARRLSDLVGPLRPNECLVLDVERGSGVDLGYVDGFYGALAADGLLTGHDMIYGSKATLPWPAWPRAATIALHAPRYKSGDQLPQLPPAWSAITLHQWTDGGATGDPYACPGVGSCDASRFLGTQAELDAWVTRAPF